MFMYFLKFNEYLFFVYEYLHLAKLFQDYQGILKILQQNDYYSLVNPHFRLQKAIV